jgi:hypothetical protein
MTVLVEIPLKTVRGKNAREHHMARHRRVRDEKAVVRMALSTRADWRPRGLCWTVTLTRVAPSKGLDGDNLQGALAAVRDAVASVLGIDDGSPDITWRYAQETTPSERPSKGNVARRILGPRYLVRILVEPR